MNELDKALQYVRENWPEDEDFSPTIEHITDVGDLLEEYGADNDLPEGWYYEYGEEEDMLEKLDNMSRQQQ